MSEAPTRTSKLTKWFCYTVLIGLIPAGLRFLSSKLIGMDVSTFSASDFIAFGFVLHISILNELEHINGDETWKTWGNLIAIVGVVFYSALMFSLLVIESGYDKIHIEQLTQSSLILAVCSFVISFIIFFRLSRKFEAESLTSQQDGEQPC